ncbi:MAG: hypothetical protein ACREA0_32990, partial [bacterium]
VRRVIKNLLRAADVLKLDLGALFPKMVQIVIDVDHAINPNLAQNMRVTVDVFDKEARRILRRKSRLLPRRED